MENASKALLMAGGVLIAIMILTLGVFFAQSMAEQESRIYRQMEESERTEFNQQFLQFTNQSINIQDVMTLINLAKNSNERNGLKDDLPSDSINNNSLYVTVDASDIILTDLDSETLEHAEKITDDKLAEILNTEIKNNKLYSCTIKTNSNTGYVNYIEIN